MPGKALPSIWRAPCGFFPLLAVELEIDTLSQSSGTDLSIPHNHCSFAPEGVTLELPRENFWYFHPRPHYLLNHPFFMSTARIASFISVSGMIE